jgi:hypothetical protein
VAQIGLQGSRIETLIRQRVAAGMPKHVRMDLKADFGCLAGAREKLGKARRGGVGLICGMCREKARAPVPARVCSKGRGRTCFPMCDLVRALKIRWPFCDSEMGADSF